MIRVEVKEFFNFQFPTKRAKGRRVRETTEEKKEYCLQRSTLFPYSSIENNRISSLFLSEARHKSHKEIKASAI